MKKRLLYMFFQDPDPQKTTDSRPTVWAVFSNGFIHGWQPGERGYASAKARALRRKRLIAAATSRKEG